MRRRGLPPAARVAALPGLVTDEDVWKRISNGKLIVRYRVVCFGSEYDNGAENLVIGRYWEKEGFTIAREDLRIVVFPERSGSVREWRWQDRHRLWLSIASAAAALLVSAVVFMLVAAYQDIVATTHLRRELAASVKVQLENRVLREQLARAQARNIQALTQVDAMAADVRHVETVLGMHFHATDSGLGNLLSRLDALHQQLPGVLAQASQRDIYLQHRPDMLPVQGPISSWYGWRANPFTNTGSEWHPGLDIAVPMYTPVVSVGAGTVTYAGWKPGGFGYYVQVDNGYGISSFVSHNSRVLVQVGQHVKRGQEIALSGSTGRSTGPHVYFGILLNGVSTNPWPFIHDSPSGVN